MATSHADQVLLVLFTGWWHRLNLVTKCEPTSCRWNRPVPVVFPWTGGRRGKTLQPSTIPPAWTEGSQVAQKEQQARRSRSAVEGEVCLYTELLYACGCCVSIGWTVWSLCVFVGIYIYLICVMKHFGCKCYFCESITISITVLVLLYQ